MNIGGWITMILSLAIVYGSTFLCFRKVLETPEEEKVPVGFGP